jgi:hypothetical protein
MAGFCRSGIIFKLLLLRHRRLGKKVVSERLGRSVILKTVSIITSINLFSQNRSLKTTANCKQNKQWLLEI